MDARCQASIAVQQRPVHRPSLPGVACVCRRLSVLAKASMTSAGADDDADARAAALQRWGTAAAGGAGP